MACFGNGLKLPKDNFILSCSDKEAEALLKMRNGKKPIFELYNGGENYIVSDQD